jgi:hypothetical protein
VHEVLAPRDLRQYTMDVARRLARTPAALLELVKDNLNAAEDEAARRRYLFAREAENQVVSARLMRDRIRRGTASGQAYGGPGRRGRSPAPPRDQPGRVESLTCGVTSTTTSLRTRSGRVAASLIAVTPPSDIPTTTTAAGAACSSTAATAIALRQAP